MKEWNSKFKIGNKLAPLCLMCVIGLSGCFWSTSEIEEAKKALKKESYDEALIHLERATKRDPESDQALEAGRLAARVALLQTNEFERAIQFYRFLIVHSQDAEERKEAQKKVAAIYFDKLSDFNAAIREYSKILHIPHNSQEGFEAQFSIVKSYYQLNKFYQAEIELDELLKRNLSKENRFQVQLFKANLFLATKRLKKAVESFSQLINDYPKESAEENVALSLAVAYEEQEELDKAIDVLKNLKESYATPEFLELKIKRLEERRKNMPGAQGYKK